MAYEFMITEDGSTKDSYFYNSAYFPGIGGTFEFFRTPFAYGHNSLTLLVMLTCSDSLQTMQALRPTLPEMG